jgi:3-isopropylmalate/(R)-2-methylmalate dehydratase small subunit
MAEGCQFSRGDIMALEKITKLSGRGVYVPGDDVDTDRIIPARYMKVVTFDGLGDFMFKDVRETPDGKKTNHVLNDPRFAGSSVMLVGSNFGCGSSREHAPQAIKRAGFNAIIGESFAEIFYGNSTTLGMPCVEATKEQIAEMAQDIEKDPSTDIEIDLEKETVTVAGKTYQVNIRPTAKSALTQGKWDPIGELLEADVAITQTAKALPYIFND